MHVCMRTVGPFLSEEREGLLGTGRGLVVEEHGANQETGAALASLAVDRCDMAGGLI